MTEADEQETISRILEGHPEIRLALLFGSIATGRATPESDLDVAIKAERALSSLDKTALIEELAEATGRPVDLIDLATAGEPLLGQILRNGKRITGSPSQLAELMISHLGQQADFLPYRERILAERRRKWTGS
jgi:predicted nucleotidyltransferase